MPTTTPESPIESIKQLPAAQAQGSPSVTQNVDKQIERTRLMVKATDLMTAIGKLVVAFLILLLIAAVGEHWLVPGGYGTNERMAFWAVAVIGGGVYFARNIFPLLLHPVNALYAADELERESPELKNSLVNLLQLREDEFTTQAVKKTIERQAAQKLAGAKPQGVDQSSLIHVGYVLLATLAITAVYIVLSPKDFFTTAGRVISPWSELAAPSRVKIEDMTPGDTTLVQGEQLEITLSILGMQEDEQAEVVYSSDDGRIVERRLSLISSSESSIGYSIQIPGTSEPLGLQSSISYRIEAGDARTRNYQAEVSTTPAIAPVSIHLDYPRYTGLEDRHIDQGGDLRGIEGTRVLLTAEANLDIESAQIDFDADGRPDIRMQLNGKQASAEFALKRRNQTKGIAPYVSSYVIRYTTKDGQTNSSPPKYPLEVFADLPPEADILEPEQEELTIGLDERIPIKIDARDPDFALKEVWLIAQKNGRTILREQLLNPGTDGHQGRFVEEYRWVAKKIGLQGGERVDYWVEALDIRNPSPQRASSRRHVFLIRPDENPEQDNQSQEDESGKNGNQGAESGDPSEDESGSEQKDQSNQSNDGDQSEEGDKSGENNNGQNGDGQEGDASEQQPNEGEQGSEGSNDNSESLQEDGDPNSDTENESDSGGGSQSNNDQQREREGNEGSGKGNREGDPNSNGKETEGGQAGGNQEQVQSDDSPVADDGSDDGAAFDRIQEHLAKKQEREPSDRPRPEVESDLNHRDDPTEEQSGEQSPDQQEGDGQNAADPEAGNEDQGKPRDETGEDPDREPDNSEVDSESGQGKSSNSQSSESTESAPSGRDSKPNDDPREGTGSSGENQAADDGTGQAGDRGEGESSGRDGNQQTGETDNQSENTEGEGNHTHKGDGDRKGSGDKPNEDEQQSREGDSEGDSPSGNNSSDERSRESDNGELSEQDPNREGNPSGPRRGGDRQPFDPNKDYASEGELGEDEANLEYARKQTELVLNELEDQIQNNEVDQQLLDKLGWSEEDLRQFVERWQARKQKAEKHPSKGNQELDDALRSLGLQQKNRRVTGPNNNKTDSIRDLQQGNRTTIPPALRDKLKRYNRGVNSSTD